MKKDTLKARAQSAKSAKAINDMVSRRVGWGSWAGGALGAGARAAGLCGAERLAF